MASLSRMPCESRRANEENTSTTVQTACASRQRVWQRRLRGADCKRECKGSRGETRCRYAHVADETTPRVVDTGIAHRQAGIGQIGAGVVQAPLECFVQALEAFATAYL
jgi:hypothetical protein